MKEETEESADLSTEFEFSNKRKTEKVEEAINKTMRFGFGQVVSTHIRSSN